MFELSAGQIVAEKYRIDGIMGTGGMGVVVAATHIELDQRVAIKFLREVSAEALARFQREARLLVRLKSPHVARVFDVGSLDDDTPYIVMEHLDGDDLATVVTKRKKLPVEETVDYILQACEAVAEAHALGMVHRDLKPANLFLARGPGGTTTVKVLDFGVSKILDDRASTGSADSPRTVDLTNEGVALGSPGYMSPEQMTSSRDVDARSDIFSLGALLYRLVGGQTPFKGAAVVSILATMAIDGLTPLSTLTPDVPPAFAAIVEKCLAQDKALRFPTVAHLAHALLPFATRRGRVIIEQILATMNVTFPDDAWLDNSAVGSPLRDTVVRPALPPAPAMGPRASLGPSMQTGPQFTVSAPGGTPPVFVPAGRAATARVPLLAISLGVLGVIAGFATWRALRGMPHHGDEPGAPEVETSTAADSAVVAAPAASSAVAPVASVSATAPRASAPTRGRAPHPPPPHSASGNAPTPTPTDVPGGRH